MYPKVQSHPRTASLSSTKPNVVEAYSSHYRMMSIPKTALALMVGVGALLAILNHEFSHHRTRQVRASTTYHPSYRSASNEIVTPPLKPQARRVHNTPVYYMIPNETTRGLLVFFHGCTHSGQDMFQLPEDRIIALAALNRGLAVLSITSMDRTSGCWSSADEQELRASNVVDAWMQSVGLSLSLPRMGMGVSSGGSFLFSIYDVLHLQSIAAYISPRSFPQASLSESADTLPATLYVHMPRDDRIGQLVESNVENLRSAGVSTKAIQVPPHPFTRQLCERRLPELGDRRCDALFTAIEQQTDPQLLDSEDSTVLMSNRRGDWDNVLAPFDRKENLLRAPGMTGDDTLLSVTDIGGHSWLWAAVNEEVAVSYGKHETTAEQRSEVLDFLMENAGLEIVTGEESRSGSSKRL